MLSLKTPTRVLHKKMLLIGTPMIEMMTRSLPDDEESSDDEDELITANDVTLALQNLSAALAKFNTGDDKHLKGAWGNGSLRSKARQADKKRKLAAAASAPGQTKLNFFGGNSQRPPAETPPQRDLKMISGFPEDSIRATIESLDTRINSSKDNVHHYDQMRLIAARIYIDLLLGDTSKTKASEIAARCFPEKGRSYKARQIRVWARLLIQGKELPVSNRGTHAKTKTLIDDEDVRRKCLKHLRSLPPKDVNPAGLRTYVNDELIPALTSGKPIHINTAGRWLKKLGFETSKLQKGIYVDGHDREDVVEYREKFLRDMAVLQSRMDVWVDDGAGGMVARPPNLDPGIRRHVLVVHDECSFHANDHKKTVWAENGRAVSMKKDDGKALMVSTFLCECHGELYRERSGIKEKVRAIIAPGNSPRDDGYWTSEKMLDQFQNKVLPAFEELHPDCVGVFMFDNSTNHKKMPDDALVASRLNLSDGGKNSRKVIRDGQFGANVSQPMIDDKGVQKGIRRILEERGLWEPGMKLADARQVLESQDDFRNQRSVLEECVRSYRDEEGNERHVFILLPKFHCELNHIERFWSSAKRFARQHCDYTFAGLRKNVPLALDSVSVDTIRRNARSCFRWMDAYRKGLSTPLAQYAVKKYSSHRRIPENLDLGLLEAEMKTIAKRSLG